MQQQISPLQKLEEFVDNEEGYDPQTSGGMMLGGQGENNANQVVQVSQQNHDFRQVSCGAEHSFALSTTGELYSWGINFKGQCGLQDFENRCRPTLVKNMSPSFHESGQHDEILNKIAEQQRLQKQGGDANSGARGGMFNAQQKTNKSMDGSLEGPNGNGQGLPEHEDEILRQMNQLTQDILNEDIKENLYLLRPKEYVEQVECGSLHTMVRTNMNRLFSCGNGSTYALGHGNKETCKGFK